MKKILMASALATTLLASACWAADATPANQASNTAQSNATNSASSTTTTTQDSTAQ